MPFIMSGQVRPRQGTEICNFGAPSPLEALHWIFCFFSSIYVQFSKTSPLKSGESSEKSSGENRVKSCHVCGCLVFFGPHNDPFYRPRDLGSWGLMVAEVCPKVVRLVALWRPCKHRKIKVTHKYRVHTKGVMRQHAF